MKYLKGTKAKKYGNDSAAEHFLESTLVLLWDRLDTNVQRCENAKFTRGPGFVTFSEVSSCALRPFATFLALPDESKAVVAVGNQVSTAD